jgi:hypothetical protein
MQMNKKMTVETLFKTYKKTIHLFIDSSGTDRIGNVSSIIAWSLVAGGTCPQGCSLATAVLLSPVYTAVTWQWIDMPHYNAGRDI